MKPFPPKMVSQIRLSPNPSIHRVFLRRDPPLSSRSSSARSFPENRGRIWKRGEAKMDILGFECSYSWGMTIYIYVYIYMYIYICIYIYVYPPTPSNCKGERVREKVSLRLAAAVSSRFRKQRSAVACPQTLRSALAGAVGSLLAPQRRTLAICRALGWGFSSGFRKQR